MTVTPHVGRFTTLLVLMLAVSPFGAEAQQFDCWPIVRGDTAYTLALRLTGNTATAYSESFQIKDPSRRTFVPKSRYDRLSTEWQACVARAPVEQLPLPSSQEEAPRRPSRYNAVFASQVGVVVFLVLLVSSAVAAYAAARPIPPAVQRVGEDFVRAFAWPLIDPSAAVPPIAVRLRFVRHAEQLEICIAPNGGRRYPNLLDHKKNVEYDVHRVLQVLGPAVAVSDCLRAEGKWVVVPIRVTHLKQAGAK
jgi:hypothetical protein